MSLALSTLIYEWRRYLAAVIALALSGLLVLSFVGLFVGMSDAFTATINRSRADIMVLAPKSESLMNGGNGLPRRVEPQIYMNPEVIEVSDLRGDGAPWANHPAPGQKQIRDYVQINMVDTTPGAVTLPTDYPDAWRVALSEPYAVLIDQTDLHRLGVKLGDEATLNRKTVRVRGVTTGYPNLAQATVVMSRQTLMLMGLDIRTDRTGPLMVRLRDPSAAVRVRDELNAVADGKYRAWTRAELAKANESALLKDQMVGMIIVFAVVVGTAIGLGITWQTLRGAIFANIKEFASLRALGVSMGSLRLIVVELSFWVGVAGLLVTASFLVGVSFLARSAGLPMGFPLPIVGACGVIMVVIAVLSGVFSLGVLKQSQPADLLR